MIFQDPMTSLNPVYRIGEQIVEAIRTHEQGRQAPGEAPRGRAAEAGRDPEPRAARRRLPAPVLGRHAAARDDRDGALLQPGRPDRRRADDGARRDDPGADHRADRPAQGRLQLGGDPDHARPRRRRRDRRRDPRDVRRPRRRAGGEARALLRPAASRTRGACSARSRGSTGRSPTSCTRSRARRRR